MARRRFRPPSFRPVPTTNTLVVVFRDKAGTVGHIAVGSALLDADWGAALSMLPSGADAEASPTSSAIRPLRQSEPWPSSRRSETCPSILGISRPGGSPLEEAVPPLAGCSPTGTVGRLADY